MAEQAEPTNQETQNFSAQDAIAQEAGHEYDHLFDPNAPDPAPEAAAIRPEATKSEHEVEVKRQIGISEADVANRQAAGLPPRRINI
jgi:hypothetical protein